MGWSVQSFKKPLGKSPGCRWSLLSTSRRGGRGMIFQRIGEVLQLQQPLDNFQPRSDLPLGCSGSSGAPRETEQAGKKEIGEMQLPFRWYQSFELCNTTSHGQPTRRLSGPHVGWLFLHSHFVTSRTASGGRGGEEVRFTSAAMQIDSRERERQAGCLCMAASACVRGVATPSCN